ncbi:MAG: flagellar hook capping FlgD N-terminal domain-containing protein, partial [Acidobacteriaceae bacterium]
MNIQGFSPLLSAPQQAQAASTPATGTTGTTGTSGTNGTSSSSSGTDALSSGNLQSTFLNLLVTELQNQD